MKVGRWTLTAADTLNYSPNSPFGGYGYSLAPASNASTTSSIINPQYVPNQTILTPYASSYLNTALGQVEYGLTRRSSWTATGSYGIMRFPDSGLYDTNQLVASTGYNHSLTARDSIYATYNYSQFHYTAYDSSFTSQNAQFGYSRKVTGRMSFQVSGGPEFINATSIGASQKKVQFSGSANVGYSRARTNFGLTYFAGVTGGFRCADRSTNAERPVYGGTFLCSGLDDKLLSWIFQQQRFGSATVLRFTVLFAGDPSSTYT